MEKGHHFISPYMTQKVIDGFNSLMSFSGPGIVVEQFGRVVNSIATKLEKINMDIETDIVTLAEIQEAFDCMHSESGGDGGGLVIKTPTLKHVQNLFRHVHTDVKDSGFEESSQDVVGIPKLPDSVDLYLKMENMQNTGSFKIRGCANQIRKMKDISTEGPKRLVTYSAGNYGKAFAYCVGNMPDTSSLVIMPDDVPKNRISIIKGFGADVKLVPRHQLIPEVQEHVAQGYQLFQSFNDVNLIAGNASAAMEILEEVPDPDIILVCCGGGGLVSGVSAAVNLSGLKDCRVYAVEPEGANTMHESFKQRRAVSLTVKSVATGLSPPHAGDICYKHCRWFVEDVLLVSDEEILSAMRILFCRGIKAEPSGCAAMAALLFNKVPDAAGKKVVVVITGGNVTPSELLTHIPDRVPQSQS